MLWQIGEGCCLERREKEMVVLPHQLILQDRTKLELTGITEVDSFDDETVHCTTSLGRLSVCGHGLHLHRLDLEGTALSIEGHIDSLSYSNIKKGGVFGRLLR